MVTHSLKYNCKKEIYLCATMLVLYLPENRKEGVMEF